MQNVCDMRVGVATETILETIEKICTSVNMQNVCDVCAGVANLVCLRRIAKMCVNV